MSTARKYLINVDSYGSKLHLNPIFFGGKWCRLKEGKMREEGGKIYVTREEAIEYLEGKKPLTLDG